MQNFSYLCKVKKKHTDIDRMVMESHYLESLERESSPSLSDMERQDYIDQINDLKASNRRLMDMIDTLKQTLDSVTASSKRNEELVKKLSAQIEAYQKQIRNLEDRNQRRKSSLHHSSEDGLQMALAYMTIIETAKRLGHEIKDFLVRAWREAIYGNNDLEALLQPAIATK